MLNERRLFRPLSHKLEIIYQQHIDNINILRSFLGYCSSLSNDYDRYLGKVILSPPIGAYNGARRDWVLIKLDPSKYGQELPNNLVAIVDFGQATQRLLRHTGDTLTVEGTTINCATFDPMDDFLHLQNFVSMRTIRHLDPTLNNINGRSLDDKEEQETAIRVFKYGALSGATRGILNHVDSYVWKDCDKVTRELCVLPAPGVRRTFSEEGDSGSVVFTIISREQGEKAIAAVLGLMWGGHNETPNPRQDITYVTPFEIIKSDIEEYAQAKLVGLEPLFSSSG